MQRMVGMSSERLERIGESMRSLIDSNKIPGTVTLVARKGKVVHFEANGSRDIERDQPMKKDTIFQNLLSIKASNRCSPYDAF